MGVKHSRAGGGVNPAIGIYASYVDIVDFDVNAPYGLAGIELEDGGVSGNGSHNRIVGNHVHNVAGGCMLGFCDHRYYPSPHTGGAGILIGGNHHRSFNNDVIGNLIHDVGDPSNPYNANLTHGIYIANGGESLYTTGRFYATRAQNNIIYRVEGTGIEEYHCTSRDIVTNNTVTDAGVSGIQVSGQPAGGSPRSGCVNRDSVVANNIVMHNGWHTRCGLIGQGKCVTEHDAGGGCGIMSFPISSSGKFLHNLSFANRCGYSPKDLFSIAGSAHKMSNNVLNTDPGFVEYRPGGGGDYHLRAHSPAIDRGTAVDAPNTDFEGRERPQGSGYDIGAYEFAR